MALAIGVLAGGVPAKAQCPEQWFPAGDSATGQGASGVILQMFELGNGDVLVGGDFTRIGGINANRIALYRPNTNTWSALGSGVSGPVYAMTITPNSGSGSTDYIIGGAFTSAGGVSVNNIARYDPVTGQWSAIGNGVTGGTTPVNALSNLPNGDVLVGGSFTTADGQPVNRIARLVPSNSPPTWTPLGSGLTSSGGGTCVVYESTVLAGNEILVGGIFDTAGGQPANFVARYSFTTGMWSPLGTGLNNSAFFVRRLFPTNDVLIGGAFTSANGVPANRVARYNFVTGTWTSLGVGTNGFVLSLTNLPGGEYLFAGDFTSAGGIPANRIARYNPTTGAWRALDQLGANGRIRATVAQPLNNSDGRLILGGNFTTVTPGASASDRFARVTLGAPLPIITTQPQSVGICSSGSATFTVGATNATSYVWRRGTTIVGTNSPTLTINPVAAVNAGVYTCTVSNNCASIVSDPATLAFGTPLAITQQPAAVSTTPGGTASFSVTVSGAGATYQWRLRNVNIDTVANPSAATSTLTLTNVQRTDNGTVTCVVSNPCGSVTTIAPPLWISCPTSFRAPTFHSAGNRPFGAAAADFNGDGLTDAVIANAEGNDISVLLSNGDGTFRPAVNYATGGRPGPMAIADFNADGRPDIAVSCFASPCVVLLNNGNGTFAPATPLGGTAQNTGIAAGDFNGDGRPDLVYTRSDSNEFFIFLNNGNGTFAAPSTTAMTSSPGPVATADLNRDGRMDLIIVNNLNGGSASVFLGNGNGTFAAPQAYATGGLGNSIAVADFSGDGNPDVVIASDPTGNVAALLGNSNGTLRAVVQYAVGSSPQQIAVADYNADGRPDLAVVNHLSDSVTVRLSNSNSAVTFAPPTTYPGGIGGFGLAAGDFNNDGRIDLIGANYWGDNASTILNTGPSTGIAQQPVDVSACRGSAATLSLSPFGAGPFTYQWRKGGTPINTVANPSAATASFTISNVQSSDAGAYDCIVGNACSSVTSNAATLRYCVADMDDGSGMGTPDCGVTIDDLLYYIALFEQGAIAGDVDDGSGTGTPDGGVTIDDLLYFLDRFQSGC